MSHNTIKPGRQVLADTIENDDIYFKRFYGKIIQSIFGYGSCVRCWRPWNVVKYHVTNLRGNNDGTGIFPMCQECWKELSPEKRLIYYKIMWCGWSASIEDKNHAEETYFMWPTIEKAVLSGW